MKPECSLLLQASVGPVAPRESSPPPPMSSCPPQWSTDPSRDHAKLASGQAEWGSRVIETSRCRQLVWQRRRGWLTQRQRRGRAWALSGAWESARAWVSGLHCNITLPPWRSKGRSVWTASSLFTLLPKGGAGGKTEEVEQAQGSYMPLKFTHSWESLSWLVLVWRGQQNRSARFLSDVSVNATEY